MMTTTQDVIESVYAPTRATLTTSQVQEYIVGRATAYATSVSYESDTPGIALHVHGVRPGAEDRIIARSITADAAHDKIVLSAWRDLTQAAEAGSLTEKASVYDVMQAIKPVHLGTITYRYMKPGIAPIRYGLKHVGVYGYVTLDLKKTFAVGDSIETPATEAPWVIDYYGWQED